MVELAAPKPVAAVTSSLVAFPALPWLAPPRILSFRTWRRPRGAVQRNKDVLGRPERRVGRTREVQGFKKVVESAVVQEHPRPDGHLDKTRDGDEHGRQEDRRHQKFHAAGFGERALLEPDLGLQNQEHEDRMDRQAHADEQDADGDHDCRLFFKVTGHVRYALFALLKTFREASARGQLGPPASPRLYTSRSSLDRWASIRRTSRRWPFTRGIFIASYPVVWCRIQAITAASARRSIGILFVLATVPLPTGVACSVTALASFRASSACRP